MSDSKEEGGLMPRDFLNAEEREKVRPIKVPWDKILEESVIVEINVSKWHPSFSLGVESLRRLGVQIDDPNARVALQQTVRLGQMDLIPREVIRRVNRLEQQARSLLRVSSHKVLFGYIVHASAYPAWKEAHEGFCAEYGRIADYISENMFTGDNLVGQMMRQYELVFADSYRRLSRAGALLDKGERAFIEDSIDFVVSHVPNAETVRSRYRFETWLSETPMVDELAKREANARQIRAEMELSEENLDKERRRILKLMEQDIEAQASERKERLDQSFFQAEMLFYQSITQAASDIQATIIKNDGLSGRSGLQLRNMITRVRSLNIFDNQELAQDIEQLDQTLEKRLKAKGASREVALETLREILGEVEVKTRRELRLLPQKRGIRQLSMPEDGTDDNMQRVVRAPFKEESLVDTSATFKPVVRRRANINW